MNFVVNSPKELSQRGNADTDAAETRVQPAVTFGESKLRSHMVQLSLVLGKIVANEVVAALSMLLALA